jgi:hypothetical protein
VRALNDVTKTIGLAALVGLGVFGVAFGINNLTVFAESLPDGGVLPGDIVLVFSESKVVFDGGDKLYAVPALLPDGGRDVALMSVAPCKRRLPGNLLCFLSDGGLPPEFNRYPADSLEGICEGVACSVLAGVDADGPEVAQ